jgi:hypothetical protein
MWSGDCFKLWLSQETWLQHVAVASEQTHNLQSGKHASGDTRFRLAEDTSFKVWLSQASGDTSFTLAEGTRFKVCLPQASGDSSCRLTVDTTFTVWLSDAGGDTSFRLAAQYFFLPKNSFFVSDWKRRKLKKINIF